MSDIVKRQSTELVKYNKEQFLKEFAPRTCMVQLRNITTLEMAVKSDLNQLATLVKQFDRDFVISYLQLWIIDLNEFLNLTNRMTAEQIKDTAELIYQDNFNLNIADVNLVFTNAKKGVYGQLYGSIDGSKLLRWFAEYRNYRAEYYFDNSFREHDIIKKHGYLKGIELLKKQDNKDENISKID